MMATVAVPLCAFPGCSKTPWQDPSGSLSAYCGRTHRDQDIRRTAAQQPSTTAPTSGVQTLCKNCDSRPVYSDSGRPLEFCSKQCASDYQSKLQAGQSSTAAWSTPASTQKLCKNCNVLPVYVQNGQALDFCGRTCAAAYAQAQQSMTMTVTMNIDPAQTLCKNCKTRPVYVDNGRALEFCGKRCASIYNSKANTNLTQPALQSSTSQTSTSTPMQKSTTVASTPSETEPTPSTSPAAKQPNTTTKQPAATTKQSELRSKQSSGMKQSQEVENSGPQTSGPVSKQASSTTTSGASSTSTEALCKNCNTRPVYVDNGRALEFCGKRCAAAYQSQTQQGTSMSTAAVATAQGFCKNCKTRPVYVENGNTFEFCGKRCASEFRGATKTQQGTTTPSTSSSPTLCKNCNSKPVFVDNGRPLEFCGKRCATDYQNKPQSQHASSTTSAPTLCKNCNSRPVYVENGHPLEFCSKACAAAYSKRSSPPRASVATHLDECSLSQCHQPIFVDKSGKPSMFCSSSHGRQAVQAGEAEGCIMCGIKPKTKITGRYSDFCSNQCRDSVISEAPIILPLGVSHQSYKDVANQFTKSWKRGTAPTVVKIWKVYTTDTVNNQFLQYRQTVEQRTGLEEGNTRRRWHGTVRACTLGEDDQSRHLCTSTACSLCAIIRSSFKVAHAGTRTGSAYGPGIYTSATSSKSDGYVARVGHSVYKALLLNEVVMGKGKKISGWLTSQAPQGYDSVIVEPGILHDDESIVYTNDAIRPKFLVVYK